jgi:flagellar biosynthetic protein FliQ
MNQQNIIDIGSRAALISVQVASPVLITAVLVGIFISIFQAATQINEQTITFVPKILMIVVVLAITGPWILQTMVVFSVDIFNQIPEIIKGD